MNTAIIPPISSAVSLIFALTVLDQFFARRKPYQLVWAIGLFMYFAFSVFTASVDVSSLRNLSGAAMPRAVRSITPFFNTFGTFALVGGAAYSAWVFWRRRDHALEYERLSEASDRGMVG